MTNGCDVCVRAEVDVLTGLFNGGCDVCAQRHLAHLHLFFESRKTQSITPAYYAALERRFGVEGVTAAHAGVKAWADRIELARAGQTAGA